MDYLKLWLVTWVVLLFTTERWKISILSFNYYSLKFVFLAYLHIFVYAQKCIDVSVMTC